MMGSWGRAFGMKSLSALSPGWALIWLDSARGGVGMALHIGIGNL